MTTLAQLAATTPRHPQNVCGVCQTLADLPADDAAILARLLNGFWRHVDIADTDTMRERGVDAAAIGRHRRGLCKAGRNA